MEVLILIAIGLIGLAISTAMLYSSHNNSISNHKIDVNFEGDTREKFFKNITYKSNRVRQATMR